MSEASPLRTMIACGIGRAIALKDAWLDEHGDWSEEIRAASDQLAGWARRVFPVGIRYELRLDSTQTAIAVLGPIPPERQWPLNWEPGGYDAVTGVFIVARGYGEAGPLGGCTRCCLEMTIAVDQGTERAVCVCCDIVAGRPCPHRRAKEAGNADQ